MLLDVNFIDITTELMTEKATVLLVFFALMLPSSLKHGSNERM